MSRRRPVSRDPGPAHRFVLRAVDAYRQRHGRLPRAEQGAELVLDNEDLARQLFHEQIRFHLRPDDMPGAVQDVIAEYAGGGTDGWALLWFHEMEPDVFGFRVTIGEALKPALEAERRARDQARMDPETRAAIERGRRILGLDAPRGPDGRPIHLLGPDGRPLA